MLRRVCRPDGVTPARHGCGRLLDGGNLCAPRAMLRAPRSGAGQCRAAGRRAVRLPGRADWRAGCAGAHFTRCTCIFSCRSLACPRPRRVWVAVSGCLLHL